MITPSAVRTVWKQRCTPQKQKIWASFYIPRRLHHSKTNEQIITQGSMQNKLKRKNIWRVKPFED
jgi:hypothetical protein